MNRARDRWLEEGAYVLAEEGVGGVRIDRLAARLGLSKGSFHHHFAGADGFKKELLNHVEEILTNSLHDAIAESRGKDARSIFARLISLISAEDNNLYRPRLETALRAWALTDPIAARTQTSIDEARLTALEEVWRRISDDEDDVRLGALLPYVIALGATVIMPPLDTNDLRQLYERILPLVPEDAP